MSSYGLDGCEGCVCHNCMFRVFAPNKVIGCIGARCGHCIPDEPNGWSEAYSCTVNGYKHHDCKVRKAEENE